MHFLSIYLFVPIINALITTKIHRNSIYRPDTSCTFISNTSTWPNDVSIQSCIWECVHTYDCQTAVYFKDAKVCSMFSELCEKGSIESSGYISASVICYRKNHDPIITCSSTATTNQEDKEEITSTQRKDSSTIATLVSDLGSFWSFDNDTSDSLSNFNGVAIKNPTYKTPGINGYGSALSFDGNHQQYVNITKYRNLTYRSFTVEMWFYCTNLINIEHGLFGQYHSPNTAQSLHYQIRNHNLYLAFYYIDLPGSTTIQINTWYHVAFVYDYSSLTQQIYLNGIQDGIGSSLPYKGTSGSIVIGKTEQIPNIPNYFFGHIDEVLLTMRSKNSSEILDDATLVCWYSFDNDSYTDSGPLHLIGTAVNVTFVTGKFNQAINFTSNSSYYQINGFVLLGISNYPYSIAFWVHPAYTINGSTLVHLSTTINGQGRCADLIGFSSTGQIIITGWGISGQEIIGPILPANAWTHVVNTFSTTNGYKLYVNGTLIDTKTSIVYIASGNVIILTLGNPLQGTSASGGSCNSQSISPNVYNGSVDEFRVYSRELNSIDIQTLAKP